MKSAEWQVIRRTVWERDKGICGICQLSVDFGAMMHVDHVVPRALGGSDELHNLRATHAKCNQAQNRGGYAPHVRIIHTKAGTRRVAIVPRATAIAEAFSTSAESHAIDRRERLEALWREVKPERITYGKADPPT